MSEALIYETLFVARWLQSRFEKGLITHCTGFGAMRGDPVKSRGYDFHWVSNPKGLHVFQASPIASISAFSSQYVMRMSRNIAVAAMTCC